MISCLRLLPSVPPTNNTDPLMCSFFMFFCCRSQWSAPERSPDIHSVPDIGAGKRIPHKSLPHEATTYRDGARVMSHRATDQNLVPKPTYETEERNSGDQGIKRTGKTGAGTESCGCCSGGSSCAAATARRRRTELGVGAPRYLWNVSITMDTPSAARSVLAYHAPSWVRSRGTRRKN